MKNEDFNPEELPTVEELEKIIAPQSSSSFMDREKRRHPFYNTTSFME